MTTAICEKPYGRASFARVLVEIDSSKALVDNVELWYESLGKILKLWVEYTWVPPRCDECKVYGHYLSECAKKVNTVSKVNKDGENVRNIGNDKDNSTGVANNGDGEEGWQTATNRRNNRGMGYNTRQGPSGGYNVRGGVSNNRGAFNYRGNQYTGNAGTRNVSQKPEPVNNGNVGKVDESVVINDNGQNINKGKSKVNENGTSNTRKSNNGSVDSKKSMANNNYVNKSDKSKKGGNEVSTKDVSGAKNVATSNRFDLLRDDNVCEEVDPWKEVKELVVAACNMGVPIDEVVLKNWNEDMIKFYSVKWNNRSKKSGYIKQQLESEMIWWCLSIIWYMVQIHSSYCFYIDIVHPLYSYKPAVVYGCWVCWFCLGTGLWKCNQIFDRGDDMLAKLLCTTEMKIASCAGCPIVGMEYGRLCTTGTDLIFCADNLYWIMRCYDIVWDRDVGCVCNMLWTTESRVASCAGCRIVVLEVRQLCNTGTDPSFCAGILYWITMSTGQSYGCVNVQALVLFKLICRMVSSIGIPIIMDKITTSICEKPYGRASFARVLVEIDSSKKPVDSIELWYESLGKVLRLGVEYTWVPPRCDECKIFGHFTSDCARKINTVKAVDKNGDNVKATEVNKFKNTENGVNNGGADEGWQMVGNRRNVRGGENSVRQGNVGGFNTRRGMNNNYRGVYVNKATNNVGNVGAKDTSSKTVPVNSANVGKLDDTVVTNENSGSANKGKGKSNESDAGTNGNNNMGNVEPKKDVVQKNPGVKNDRATTKGHKNVTGSKSGEDNNPNVVLGTKNVVTSNRFDLLSKEGISEEADLWKVVKEKVLKACNSNVPIKENILKGWNTDMVKFYTLKWKSRARKKSYC
ncbi:zinc knuckle CX2CX4HX4C [Artemisia annua]|uniref:Zinc knuckle CX2CX4HX4C n=1 Tax=Artemisia annua TaxID=35608 RepID=A0A2U1KIY9_ARTAN|nr:zinc knuckle CX2CX4HX4C [Artemisia annua]